MFAKRYNSAVCYPEALSFGPQFPIHSFTYGNKSYFVQYFTTYLFFHFIEHQGKILFETFFYTLVNVSLQSANSLYVLYLFILFLFFTRNESPALATKSIRRYRSNEPGCSPDLGFQDRLKSSASLNLYPQKLRTL